MVAFQNQFSLSFELTRNLPTGLAERPRLLSGVRGEPSFAKGRHMVRCAISFAKRRHMVRCAISFARDSHTQKSFEPTDLGV